MASTGTQPELEIPPPPPPIFVSNTHRWIDLGLVLAVAFAGHILNSIYLSFHPVPPKYSNISLVGGILAESTALLLFLVLFKRQGRQIQSIGLSFRWTDLPIALGLVVASFIATAASTGSIGYVWSLATQRSMHWTETRAMFSSTSLWLLPLFLLLNPFFEEILVRGYLTTELIDLRKSVLLATLVSLGVQTSYHLYYGVFGAVVVGCGLAVFAIYYAISRRLMPVILAHMLWDLTALLRYRHG
jgi:membrane protease YdiL (CAAX protease family)